MLHWTLCFVGTVSGPRPHTRFLLGEGFFLQGYWLVAMMCFWDSLKKVVPATMTKQILQRAWSVVEAEMEGLRLDDDDDATPADVEQQHSLGLKKPNHWHPISSA